MKKIILEAILAPIMFILLLPLDLILGMIKFLLGIKSKSLIDRYLDWEYKQTHRRNL